MDTILTPCRRPAEIDDVEKVLSAILELSCAEDWWEANKVAIAVRSNLFHLTEARKLLNFLIDYREKMPDEN